MIAYAMKQIVFIALIVLACGFTSEPAPVADGIAVVELFTSEGCSSCPLADETLRDMTELMQRENKNVIALAFHVTYWNKLGWVDPYSDERFTERQKIYANKLSDAQSYTPQAVVNGAAEFVGSNMVAFRNAVTEAVTEPALYTIDLQYTNSGEKNAVHYRVNKIPKNMVLNISVVEKHVERDILRGENKNRKLKHYNVVRIFHSEDAKEEGEVAITWPSDLAPEKGNVIAYLQHKKTLKIVAATVL